MEKVGGEMELEIGSIVELLTADNTVVLELRRAGSMYRFPVFWRKREKEIY